ncbi:MAG: molybdate ABC transporter substrate-binding protein [Anaerolineales bacterium]|nr:molybdate ABC transporter substrate-binding protein [Anaerolineales bacterium]
MKIKHIIPSLMLLFWAACTPTASPADTSAPVTLHVFAAASLTEAFTEIGHTFEAQHAGVTVVFNFAGSSQLAQQISEGALGDIFASANKPQMEVAMQGGRITEGSAQIFATNRLVVIYPAANPAGLATLQDLSHPGLRVILAAKDVPVGGYTLDFLDKTVQDANFTPTFKDEVLANVVSYEQSVRAVLTKVVLGEADAGVVYTSDVTGDTASQVGQIEIPDELNVIASYPIATLNDSTNPDLAAAFVAYVLSPDGQQILAKYGFITVGE